MLNGDGLRVVLWVAGCNHCCRECQNPITWDPDGGLLFDEAAKQEIFEQLEKPYISGITFSGGDPMHPVNRADVRELMHEIREKYPTKTIWMYTGDSWEDIYDLPIMQYVDVVVDGIFLLSVCRLPAPVTDFPVPVPLFWYRGRGHLFLRDWHMVSSWIRR